MNQVASMNVTFPLEEEAVKDLSVVLLMGRTSVPSHFSGYAIKI